MSEPSKKQLELEQSIFSISGYNKISKNNKLREQGRESETYYARNMIEAGLEELTKQTQNYIYKSLSGQVGVKSLAALYLNQFPDIDVVSFITFKVIIDNVSLGKVTTQVAINIGQMLEDEMRYTIFEEQDPKHFKAIQHHTRDTNHQGYKKNMVRSHMSKKGIEFKTWSKENKLKIGMVLIDLVVNHIGMIKLVNKRVGKTTTSCVVFTDVADKWIRKNRANRIAAYPLYLPCFDKPKQYTTLFDGGYYTERLRTSAIKTTNQETLKKLQEENLTVCLKALNLASHTAWGVNKFVFDILVYCWEERIEVGGLIDREPLELPVKPEGFGEDKEVTKQWSYHAGLIHDTNHANKVKRFQILSMIDTAKSYLGEKFFHVYQMDFTSRLYPVTAHFHPQGTDIARALHHFYEGAVIKTKKDADWLAIAGANAFGYNKLSYDERLEWAYIEGQDFAEQVALNPLDNIDIWGQAKDPWQFLAWCKEWYEFCQVGLKGEYVSRFCCCLDGTNNGYQHIAGLISSQGLAQKVNLQRANKPQDLYTDVLARVKEILETDTTTQGKSWNKISNLLTRKFIKKPVLMIPYNSTTFGIANYIEKYFVAKNISMVKNFKNNFYLAAIIEQAVKDICPESYQVLNYLSRIALCFNKENKTISWHTPSGFLVQQKYYTNHTKRIKTKLSNQTVYLSLAEPDEKLVNKRKQLQGFPSNYIHSFDAAHLHLSLVEASKMDLKQFCIIHDCFGSPAAELDRLIECVKQTFFYIYSDNNLDNLHHQAADQLSNTKGLPPALLMGEFDITDVLTAPYIFT